MEKHLESKHHAHEGQSSSLSAFCYYPSHVRFVGADHQEKIVLLLRKHPVTNLRWLLTVALMLMVPMAASFLTVFTDLAAEYQVVALLSWYLITLAFSVEQFLTWFFNVNILTDERVFDVDFVNLLYREISEANIDQIQDVTVQMGGVMRATFNYGDVVIQTAGEIPQIEFKAVPQPDRVAKILRELRVEEEQEKLEGRVR